MSVLLTLIKSAAEYSPTPKYFTVTLPTGSHKRKIDESLERIYRGEADYTRNMQFSTAYNILDKSPLNPVDKANAYTEMETSPSGIGRLIAGTITALGAPVILDYFDVKSDTLKGLSIPLAGLGGIGFYDMLTTKKPAMFTPAYPTKTNENLNYWLNYKGEG